MTNGKPKCICADLAYVLATPRFPVCPVHPTNAKRKAKQMAEFKRKRT